MQKAIIFGGDSSALCGLPRCKIYCWLDWVFFIRAFTGHLKRCRECYFLNAFEVASAKLHFPRLGDTFLKRYAGICIGFMLPIHTDRSCAVKPQHAAVEIYPLMPRLLQPGVWLTHALWQSPKQEGLGAHPIVSGKWCQLIDLKDN